MHFKMEPLLESECEVRNCSTIRKQSSQTSVQHATTIYTKSPGWMCVLRHKIYHIPGSAAQRLHRAHTEPRLPSRRLSLHTLNGSIDPTARNSLREHGTKIARTPSQRTNIQRAFTRTRTARTSFAYIAAREPQHPPRRTAPNCSHVLALNIPRRNKHKQNEK